MNVITYLVGVRAIGGRQKQKREREKEDLGVNNQPSHTSAKDTFHFICYTCYT